MATVGMSTGWWLRRSRSCAWHSYPEALKREGSEVDRTRTILALLFCASLFLTSCGHTEQATSSSSELPKEQPTEQKEKKRPQVSAEEAEPQEKEMATSSEPEEEDPAQSSFAATTVVRIVDGDTVDIRPAVEGETRVRLIGVDTPETRDPDCGKQPYSDRATEFTRSRLQGQTVELEFDVEGTDPYGRLQAYVYPDEEEMFNETLLRGGYAQVATFPPNVKYVDRFLAAQDEARATGAGLWSLSPEELATQTDRGNGIGGKCTQSKAPQKAESPVQSPPETPPEPPQPETPFVPKVEAEQAPDLPSAPALPQGDLDCRDFTTQAQAQAYLLPGDPHRLDGNNDGEACEMLP